MATKGPTLREFQERFPTDDSCLDHMMRARYGERFNCPRCDRAAKYYRIKTRRAFVCEHCGNQIYPTAGTPFDKTRTSLRDWFFVMFLFCTSRNGVAAKEVQRQLQVTYKTAWRMCHHIRRHMGVVDGDWPVGGDSDNAGIVEIDKTFIGGKDKMDAQDKSIVLGMTERGGDVVTRVVEDRFSATVHPHIVENVKAGSRIATDESKSFYRLREAGYWHESINHARKEWMRGDVHTNTIEAFWANVKRGISGTYVWVSKKHLPVYLGEFEFRHNLRKHPYLMLEALLRSFPHQSSASR